MADLAIAPVVITPCPITLENQRREELRIGETVRQFLDRVMKDDDPETVEVRLNGELVPEDHWHRVKPKAGWLLEVRATVGRQALMIVAMVALIWVTGGMAAGGGFAGVGGMVTGSAFGAMAINAAVFVAGPAVGGRVIR